MGLAASQARLLALTARIHDVEYEAQVIQNAKLQLALQEDEVYKKYNDALDATTLTFKTYQGDTVKATFNNLCGEGSIYNKLATNKSYIFRDGDGQVIVPSDIYDAYAKFGGGDAYAFAMYMMVGEEAYNATAIDSSADQPQTVFAKAQQDYYTSQKNSDATKLTNLRLSIENQVNNLYSSSSHKDETGETKAGYINRMVNTLLESGNINDFKAYFPNDTDFNSKEFENLENTLKEYQHVMYTSGAGQIYAGITGDKAENFNQEKFNYYLRWGKLMELECVNVTQDGGLSGATKAGAYGEGDIENDPELLNQMLQSGRIIVDLVYVNTATGKIGDDPTSVGSDSILEYTNTTQIDKTAAKKAEAEYEYAMKQINKKDKQYDMTLSSLETERSALTTEYDSVKKVIQDNIERTFKIFS